MSKKLSDKVKTVLEVIKTKDLSAKSLGNIYNNTLNHNDLTEFEREELIEAIEKKIRTANPREAKKLFGPKDLQARELLNKVHQGLASEFDLSKNKVGLGVKTGGHMIAGRAYIDVYISYKNSEKWHLGLGLMQEKADTEQTINVKLYQGSENNEVGKEIIEFTKDELDNAVEKYKQLLKQIL